MIDSIASKDPRYRRRGLGAECGVKSCEDIDSS